MSKKKRKKRVISNDHSKDWHHIFFQKRHWKTDWAKLLRDHSYCGSMLPKHTLHRYIHENIKDIPVPDGKSCRMALEAINNWLETGYISMDSPIEQKLIVLINVFNRLSPETAQALRKQLEIIRNYHQRPP